MKWIIKAAAQSILGRMPARLADPIYHGLQQATRDIPIDLRGQRSFIEEAASFLQDLRDKTFSGLRIVELGSGWHPVLPLLLTREFGAETVHTFDVNHHYSPARIAQAASEIMKNFEHLREDSVLQRTALSGQLPDSIHYYPRTKIQQITEIPGGPAHLALSRSVLEYATPEEIQDIHRSSRHWLTQDALWIHLVGTSDDRARQDKKLHQFDFLKHSEKTWLRISGNRYAYKNRLRLPQYRPLFQSAGWHVEREQSIVSEFAIARLNLIPLHRDFSQFSAEELVAGVVRFALVASGTESEKKD
jgi:hypothetical protein